MKKLLLIMGFSLACLLGKASSRLDSLLNVLDRVVKERSLYDSQKEETLQHLKTDLNNAKSVKEEFELLGKIFEAYLPYNTDSATLYIRKRVELGHRLNNQEFLALSYMNMAAIYCNIGMFYEALDWLERTNSFVLTSTMLSYRLHLYRTLYGAMELFALNNQDKMHYALLTDCYRDSIKQIISTEAKDYQFVQSDQLIVRKRYAEALAMLTTFFSSMDSDSHDKAIIAYSISEAYRGLGNTQMEMEYLAHSAIADLRNSVKEYISLWKLATLLYEHGDLSRSYNYLKCSLEDATFSKSRIRTVKITEVFPIIEKAYQQRSEQQKSRMRYLILGISFLGLGLVVAVVAIGIQLRRLSAIRIALSVANNQLSSLNNTLQKSNRALHLSNQELADASHIKEEYVGRYMDLCSDYIVKMDDYRRNLNKKAAGGRIEELMDELKSNLWIKEELKVFYANFDRSFLQLFPSFVADFNALLQSGEEIIPKNGELLNTELRIFALIRLGITDSEQIARFLRYSISTIYNYRTKVRNKALGERSAFEEKVINLCR